MGACYSNPTGLRAGKGSSSNSTHTPGAGSSKNKVQKSSELAVNSREQSSVKTHKQFSSARVHDSTIDNSDMYGRDKQRIPVLRTDYQNLNSVPSKSNKFSPVRESGKVRDYSAIPRNNYYGSNGNSSGQNVTTPIKFERSPMKSCTTPVGSRNTQFLIDDEISDQPELVLNANGGKPTLTLKNSLTELEALKIRQSQQSQYSNNANLTNSTSSHSNSPNKFSGSLRRPKPLSFVESADGSVGLDSPSYRSAYQDLMGIKTLLFRLQGILHNVCNLFEVGRPIFYQFSIIGRNIKPL